MPTKNLRKRPAVQPRKDIHTHGSWREPQLQVVYHVIVQCCDEDEQETVYSRLKSEGHKCRLVML